jgi:hypothetical protein
MNNNNIVPYNNQVQFIPKDNPTDHGIYPVEYWQVSAENISSIKIGGPFEEIKQGTISAIEITGPNNTAANQKTTVTFSVSASLSGVPPNFSYQWQKQESSGGDWFNLATASGVSYTTPSLVYGADNNDLYRCIVSDLSGIAVNSPLTSSSATLSINTALISATLPEFITVNESTAASMSVSAIISNLAGPAFSYQWRKQESSGGSFSNISGATLASYTTPTISFANDYNDKYLCVISEPYAQNSPYTTNQLYLNVRRLITITSQPTAATSYVVGTTATFTVTATITSDVITYQWQKKLFIDSAFSDITGATSPSYTTPTLSSGDSGTSYRCVLTNAYADPKITNQLLLIIGDADLQISPTVNGKTYWTFATDGALVLDPSNSTTYTITALGNKTIKNKLWGQGTCNATGGYAAGTISASNGNTYTVKLNTGGGACGTGYGSYGCWAGGGYAGIFNGTSVSQGNALLIAGGAGGGGANAGQGCNRYGGGGGGSSGGSGQNSADSQIGSTGGGGGTSGSGGSGGYALETVYTTGTVQKEGGFYHIRSSGVNTTTDVQGPWTATPTQGSTSNPSDGYTYTFTTPYNDSSYSINASNASGDQNYTANGTYYPSGFYSTISDKSSTGFRVNWYSSADNSAVYVKYHSISCSGQGTTSTSTNNISASGGSALSGGTGGRGSIGGSGGANASGGGGGGAGYFGGGGGGGGNDYGNGTRDSSGGGGGSGFVAGSVINGSTSTFANSSDINRGGAGSANSNSRIVLEMPVISFSSQPSSTTVLLNATATFSATVLIPTVDLNSVAWSPAVTVSYQWQSFTSGVWNNISGANSSSYSVTATSGNNGTNYRLVVTSNYGNIITSNTATLNTNSYIAFADVGISSFTIPAGVNNIIFKAWGSGGDGTGENCGGPYSGGSGGYVEGKMNVSSSEVISIFVGQTGQGSTGGQAGSGAGQGGQFSYVKRGSDFGIAGAGGGAGQAGNGGYGGGNASGGTGTSYTSSSYRGQGGTQSGGGSGGISNNTSNGSAGVSWNNGSNTSDGGSSGGTGQGVGNRGGGGGAGYFGGGGGGGGDTGTNCQSGGGGGGAGLVSGAITNIVSYNGNTGSSSGAAAPNSSDPYYISGRGGSNQNGLVVLSWTPTYSISPSTSSVNEGSSVTITVTTTNVLNGTILYWRAGSSTITTSTNLSPTSSSVTINNNTATFNINATADSLTESGTQSFYVNLYKESAFTTLLANTSVITINDTSQTPAAPTGSFTASPTSINSGNSSTLSWNISNVTSITIDQGVSDPSIPAGNTTSSGTRSVSPTSTTTYTLVASGPGGSLTLQATVTVQSLKTINGYFNYIGSDASADYFNTGVNRTTEEVSLSFTYSVTFPGGSFGRGNSPSGVFTGGAGSAYIVLDSPHLAGVINVSISCPGYTTYTYEMYLANTY